MSKMIDIENIQSGMIIAKSIINRFGQMILPEKTKIEERHKRILKTWGIKYVTVEPFTMGKNIDVIEVEPEDEPDARLKAQAEDYLKHKMNWIPRNACETDMYNAAIKQIIEKIIGKQNDYN